MSGGISVDVDALQRFLVQLQTFNGELEDSLGKVADGWARLGESWHDKRYEEFAADWDAAVAAMEGYLGQAPGHIGFLSAKLQAAEDYLG